MMQKNEKVLRYKDLELENNYCNLKIKLKDISWTIKFDGVLSRDGLE